MFYYDITWCGNECAHIECERNIENKPNEIKIFSMSYLKDTEYCSLQQKTKKIDQKDGGSQDNE